MFSVAPGAIPIIIGIVVLTMMEMLRILATWKQEALSLHRLKLETHTLRLRLKQQSAQRIVAEERHRATYSSQMHAA